MATFCSGVTPASLRLSPWLARGGLSGTVVRGCTVRWRVHDTQQPEIRWPNGSDGWFHHCAAAGHHGRLEECRCIHAPARWILGGTCEVLVTAAGCAGRGPVDLVGHAGG